MRHITKVDKAKLAWFDVRITSWFKIYNIIILILIFQWNKMYEKDCDLEDEKGMIEMRKLCDKEFLFNFKNSSKVKKLYLSLNF